MSTSAPYGFSLFCDDLRSEVGGKLSFMGIYQTEYVFQGTFPAAFTKLVIVTMYYEPKELEPKDLEVKIYLPGDETKPNIVHKIPRNIIESNQPLHELESDQAPLFHLRLPFVVQPLMVKEEGYIKVRIVRDGVTYKFGSLYVRAAREGEFAIFRPS